MAILFRVVRASAIVVLLLVTFGAAAGQPSPSPQDSHGPVANKTQPHSEQAYSLPPDKLAQAIALNKIRVSLDIAGSLWGLILIWWVLRSGTAVRLDAWTRGTIKPRWLQGLAFFGVLLVILGIANLPLYVIGHAASLRYGISVQGWPSWFGDQGKGLAVSLVVGVPVALLFNWVVRVSPRRYWIWLWLISLPLILISVFITPLVIDPLFNKFEPLERTHAGWSANLSRSSRAPEPKFRVNGCSS